eukprot:comp21787_c0_seq2/m.48873 comp21787_c0_seq2/g.48873  ORF comp21787_c0_seq2/g.48873 comp21787_c0_seq2/m.48873 type:complete len:615 (-) comp21787_c0_seq2:541-2385(-)
MRGFAERRDTKRKDFTGETLPKIKGNFGATMFLDPCDCVFNCEKQPFFFHLVGNQMRSHPKVTQGTRHRHKCNHPKLLLDHQIVNHRHQGRQSRRVHDERRRHVNHKILDLREELDNFLHILGEEARIEEAKRRVEPENDNPGINNRMRETRHIAIRLGAWNAAQNRAVRLGGLVDHHNNRQHRRRENAVRDPNHKHSSTGANPQQKVVAVDPIQPNWLIELDQRRDRNNDDCRQRRVGQIVEQGRERIACNQHNNAGDEPSQRCLGAGIVVHRGPAEPAGNGHAVEETREHIRGAHGDELLRRVDAVVVLFGKVDRRRNGLDEANDCNEEETRQHGHQLAREGRELRRCGRRVSRRDGAEDVLLESSMMHEQIGGQGCEHDNDKGIGDVSRPALEPLDGLELAQQQQHDDDDESGHECERIGVRQLLCGEIDGLVGIVCVFHLDTKERLDLRERNHHRGTGCESAEHGLGEELHDESTAHHADDQLDQANDKGSGGDQCSKVRVFLVVEHTHCCGLDEHRVDRHGSDGELARPAQQSVDHQWHKRRVEPILWLCAAQDCIGHALRHEHDADGESGDQIAHNCLPGDGPRPDHDRKQRTDHAPRLAVVVMMACC